MPLTIIQDVYGRIKKNNIDLRKSSKKVLFFDFFQSPTGPPLPPYKFGSLLRIFLKICLLAQNVRNYAKYISSKKNLIETRAKEF